MWRAFPDPAKTALGSREGTSVISIEPRVYAELKARLAQSQGEQARAVAELRGLPPTRPEGAKRMWLPDEGDGRDWAAAGAMAAE